MVMSIPIMNNALGTVATIEQPSSIAQNREFLLFSSLWAAATLFHLGSYDQWREHSLLALAAACILCLPGSVVAFLVLAIVQVLQAAKAAPYNSNHWIFTTIINAGILLAATIQLLKRRRLVLHGADLLAVCGPMIRVTLIAFYFFVVFHKLNTDFFDSSISCGATLYVAQLPRLTFLPNSMAFQVAAVYLTVGVETAIPVLLILSRTRSVGVIAGALFHYVVALNPANVFYNFSAMLLAVFALFTPQSVTTHRFIGSRTCRLLLAGLAGMFVINVALLHSRLQTLLHGIDPFLALWLVYGAGLIATFTAYVCRHRKSMLERVSVFSIGTPVLVVVPLCVVINGIMPYLGLKTEGSWAMYSNLRTEGGISNHLIVPVSAQFFDFQRELVQVTGSSDGYLQSLAAKHQLIPYFELRRRPSAFVSYVRGGGESQFAHVSDDPAFSEVPWIMRKLMRFRPVDQGVAQTCRH
jgi:hypothetical protein